MNKDKLIQLLEHELVQADAATTDAAFEKHIYAIHTLTALYTGQETSRTITFIFNRHTEKTSVDTSDR